MGIEVTKYQAQSKAKSGAKSEGAFEFLNKDIQLGADFNDKAKESFYSELAMLLEAGLDMRSSLEMLVEDQRKKSHKKVLNELMDKVINGDSMAQAMEVLGKFSPYEFHSVRIGEESGSQIEVLRELSIYFQKKSDLRRQFIGVLTYPAFVIAVSFGVMYFMLSYVVPLFADMFQRFNAELPAITLMVISVSEGMGTASPYVMGALLVLVGCYFAFRKREGFKRMMSKIQRRIPLFGPLIVKVQLARMSQAMYLLTKARTPLVDAMQMVSEMMSFHPIVTSLQEGTKDIQSGIPLHASLKKHSIYPKRMISLLKVAEEVNKLDEMFKTLATQYSTEVDHRSKILGKLIEPILIIFIAGFVAIILIAMYLPLFELSKVVGG